MEDRKEKIKRGERGVEIKANKINRKEGRRWLRKDERWIVKGREKRKEEIEGEDKKESIGKAIK